MADCEIKKENIISTGSMTLFLCDFCNECYSQVGSFKLHYRAHKNFTCGICGAVYSLKRELTVHLRSHYTIKKEYPCASCDKVFNYKLELKMHERTHKTEISHICGVCESTFSSKAALKKHSTTHAAEEPNVSDICQASFRKKSSLQTHTFTHIADKNKDSNKIVESKDVVRHKTEISHICGICESTFSSKAALKKHSTTHAAEEPYVSDIGQASFRKKSSLQTHTFTHIADKNKDPNKIVESKDVKAVKDSGKQKHSKSTNKGNAQYECEICKKLFKSKADLKRHDRTHKGEKSRVKNISERAFSELPRSNNRTIEKPHVCDLCQKTFSRKSSLMSHGCTRKK